MATVKYCGSDGVTKVCELAGGEAVLEGLERHGVKVPNSCRSGVCQSCLMQATEGDVPAEAQRGLKESLRARKYLLPCVCRPSGDLTIHPAEHAAQRARAIVKRIDRLSHDVIRVVLQHDGSLDYFPGQFVNLVREDGLTRSYSLANLRHTHEGDEELLELHVRKVADGRMSTWLHEEAQPGETIDLRGPHGDCFYVAGRPEQPMLLVGTGTGLAPLYAIARDALRQGHTGPIRLYHGARNPAGLYLVDELTDLSKRHANFSYERCVMDGAEEPGLRVGTLDRIVLADTPKLAGYRVFLCGNPELVNGLRKRVFLAGAAMKEIYSDAFVMAGK
jgi:NAD(P)H-flavin reductase/ferredoxin